MGRISTGRGRGREGSSGAKVGQSSDFKVEYSNALFILLPHLCLENLSPVFQNSYSEALHVGLGKP